jgi:hypothetical protein
VSADRVTIHHTITLCLGTHESVTVFYIGWFQSVSILITELPSTRGHHIFISMLVFCLSVRATAVPGHYITLFYSEFLFKITRHSFFDLV